MKLNFSLIFLFGFLVSCHKDIDVITTEDKPDPPPILITTKLVSQNDTTTSTTHLASQVFAGSSDTYTKLPYIITEGNLIDRDFELVRLESKDQLDFYHVANLIENDVNYLHWKSPDINFALGSTTEDTEIDLVAGYSIFIPANAIQYGDGAAYSGSYKIAYASLDPLTSASEAIPSYTGILDHQHVALQFQQCFYVNVLSESDEKLKFSERASLHVPSTSNPALWKFGIEQSAWIPYETQQTPSVISLGSSLYYGIATADPAVRMTGTFNLNGKLTPHQELRISYGTVSRKIYATNSGAWVMMVPSGITCTIETTLPCGNLYSLAVTSQETPMYVPLVINKEFCVNTAYTGTLRNNIAEALHGIIVVKGEQPNFYYTDDLDFSVNIPTCLGQKNGIQGIDIATGQSGPVIYWEARDSVDMVSVFACDQANDEYLSLEVSGEKKMYWDLKTSLQQSRLVIEEGVNETELNLMLLIDGMTDREYQNTELNFVFEDEQLGSRGYSLYCPSSPNGCGFTKFVITHFPAQQGQWIRGYFEGLFWIKTFHPLTGGYRPVKGEFQVYRDF